jgi:predicted nucleic acid-binding protein
MSQIYWDTMLFIYWLEDHPANAPKVQKIFEKMQKRGDVLCTSAFTLGELLVGPRKRNAPKVADTIRQFFRSSDILVLPFSKEAAEHYAEIRANYNVAPADAIHLACAAQRGVDLFLSNDHRLRGLVIKGIQFTADIDTDLF